MNTSVTSRENILAVSRNIAMKDGIESINIRRVADSCGVSVGSIYNYFSSKGDLIAETVREIWQEIFNFECISTESFLECVQWMFDKILFGAKNYPNFLIKHSIAMSGNDVESGRRAMGRYFVHVKCIMLGILKNDNKIMEGVFNNIFSEELFVDFVFSNMVSLLMRGESSCSTLLEIIKRVIY